MHHHTAALRTAAADALQETSGCCVASSWLQEAALAGGLLANKAADIARQHRSNETSPICCMRR
jgi:hypothetical protein